MSGPTKDFWEAAGLALVIVALCLGVGTCSLLSGLADRASATEAAQ